MSDAGSAVLKTESKTKRWFHKHRQKAELPEVPAKDASQSPSLQSVKGTQKTSSDESLSRRLAEKLSAAGLTRSTSATSTSEDTGEARKSKSGEGPDTTPGVKKEEKKVAKDKPVVDKDAVTKEGIEELQSKEWYHGLMPTEEIDYVLKEEGDFVARCTEIGERTRIALSVKGEDGTLNVLLRVSSDGRWALKKLKKAKCPDLIQELLEQKIPVKKGIILKRAIPRPDHYILHEHVKVIEQIGGGAFGDVYIGDLRATDGKTMRVAIKILKKEITRAERRYFLRTAKFVRRYHHPNVVSVLGVTPQYNPLMIVLELCPAGTLPSKLKYDKSGDTDKLLVYATDAARGMTFLAGNHITHRNVAARNCLIGSNNEVKITDFEDSAAELDVISNERLDKLSVRWLAPESIRLAIFSEKSDVWSFGVLMWEIFSWCRTQPFPDLTNAEARSKILSKEPPLLVPDKSPPIVEKIMNMCFMQDPSERATFEKVFKTLAPKEALPEIELDEEDK